MKSLFELLFPLDHVVLTLSWWHHTWREKNTELLKAEHNRVHEVSTSYFTNWNESFTQYFERSKRGKILSRDSDWTENAQATTPCACTSGEFGPARAVPSLPQTPRLHPRHLIQKYMSVNILYFVIFSRVNVHLRTLFNHVESKIQGMVGWNRYPQWVL